MYGLTFGFGLLVLLTAFVCGEFLYFVFCVLGLFACLVLFAGFCFCILGCIGGYCVSCCFCIIGLVLLLLVVVFDCLQVFVMIW